MAIGNEEVDVGVVVIVEPIGTKADVQKTGLGHACGERDIGKNALPLVVIEGVGLQVQVGDNDVQPPIAIEICRVGTHPRFGLAILVVAHTGQQGVVEKGAVTLVEI